MLVIYKMTTKSPEINALIKELSTKFFYELADELHDTMVNCTKIPKIDIMDILFKEHNNTLTKESLDDLLSSI